MIRLYLNSRFDCITEDIVGKVINGKWETQEIFIAPETSKASIERLIMNRLIDLNGPKGLRVRTREGHRIGITGSLVNGDVLSFMRLAGRILEMSGYKAGSSDDMVIMRNSIYRILTEHINEFRTFGKLVGRFEYIDKLISLLGDFSRYGIGEDEIASALENSEGQSYQEKLYDLKLLFGYLRRQNEEYDLRLLSDNIMEASKVLEMLVNDPSLLEKRRYKPLSDFLKSNFTVIGFGSVRMLTPSEIRFVGLISKLGGNISFYPLYSEGDAKVFESGKMFVQSMKKNYDDVVIEVFDDGRDDSNDSVLSDIQKMYALDEIIDPDDKDLPKSDDITCASIASTDDRIAFIANEIIKLTRDMGYRYRDIRIVCVDDTMLPDIRNVMKVFGLDMFIDRRIVLDNTPVVRYATLLLEMSLRKFSVDSVLRLLRTGLSGVLPSSCDMLDNYCARYNITTSARLFDKEYFTEQKYHPMMAIVDGEEIPASELLWEEVITRSVIPLRDAALLIDSKKTIREKAEALAAHIEELSENIDLVVRELLDRKDEEKASAVVRGYNELMTLLASFSTPLNDIEISPEGFYSLIRIDMRNKSQGTIPLRVDSVEIVTPEQSFVTSCKVLFLLGAQSDNFPYGRAQEDLLTTDELSMLSQSCGVELPDKAASKHRSENVIASLMFGAATDRIYILNEYGESPSSAYTFFSAFSKEELVNCFKMPITGRGEKRRHEFNKASIDKSIMKELLEENKRISVSSLEMYNSCHMKYMLGEVLNIRRRDDTRELKTNVIGTIVHEMFEYAIKEISSECGTSSKISEYGMKLKSDRELLASISDKAFDSYLMSKGTADENSVSFLLNAGRKAKRIFSFALPILLEEAGENHYIPCDFEKKINDLKEPLIYEGVEGNTFKFVGSVDRVDRNEDSGKIRVLDYKTGDKKIDLSKTLVGIQIQLFAYVYAMMAEEGKDNVDDAGYITIGLKALKDGEISKRTKSEDILPSMSKALTKLSDEDFENVVSYVDYLIRKNCKEISSGVSDALVNSKCSIGRKPYCSYCAYSGCCGNEPGIPIKDFRFKVEKAETEGSSDSASKKLDILHTMKVLREKEED